MCCVIFITQDAGFQNLVSCSGCVAFAKGNTVVILSEIPKTNSWPGYFKHRRLCLFFVCLFVCCLMFFTSYAVVVVFFFLKL